MKKFNIIFGICCIVLSCGLFFACGDDDVEIKDDGPVIMYPSQRLYVDLNQAKLPSVIAVVNSETGLKRISTYLIKTGNVQVEVGIPVTSFFNPNSYSVTRNPSYSDNTTGFKIIAEDLAGRVKEFLLPIDIIPLRDAPKVFFYDTAGDGIETIEYFEDSPMPDIKVEVTSQENLQYVTLKQIVDGMESTVFIEEGQDTIWLSNNQTQYEFNLNNLAYNYVFPLGITGLRVYTAAGAVDKPKTATGMLSIIFKRAFPEIFITSDSEDFNGLTMGQSVNLEGYVKSASGLSSINIIPLDTLKATMSGEQIIDGSHAFEKPFLVHFNATKQQMFVRIQAVDINGKESNDTIQLHVGYKYYHLLANTASVANQSYFSSKYGRIYDPCSAMGIYKDIDAGFGTYATNTKVDLCRLDETNKLTGTCGANSWNSDKNIYNMTVSKDFTNSNFDMVTVGKLHGAVPKSTTDSKIVELLIPDGSIPYGKNSPNVALYSRSDGKKVIITGDGIEPNSSTQTNPVFYIKVKVEM